MIRKSKPATAEPTPAPLLGALGARVRRLRGERGLTLRELAERSGLSLRFVSELEAGRANIAVGRLAGVAAALDVPLEQLLRAEPAGDGGAPRARIEALLQGRSEAELLRCVSALELTLDVAPRRTAIALLGLRGAGKSTLGPRLARALGLAFVELDHRIEAAAGLSLTELFALHGEGYYRRLEHHCLAELLAGPPAVVALGGGVVHNEAAFQLVRQRCTTVWLKAAPEDHMTRVQAQGDRRPMADRDDAMAELRRLLAEREPLYRQADLTVDTSRLGADSLAALQAGLTRAGWSAPA